MNDNQDGKKMLSSLPWSCRRRHPSPADPHSSETSWAAPAPRQWREWDEAGGCRSAESSCSPRPPPPATGSAPRRGTGRQCCRCEPARWGCWRGRRGAQGAAGQGGVAGRGEGAGPGPARGRGTGLRLASWPWCWWEHRTFWTEKGTNHLSADTTERQINHFARLFVRVHRWNQGCGSAFFFMRIRCLFFNADPDQA